MHLHGNDSYLSPCFTVAKAFTLNEPTNVILEFINADNRFKVHFIKNETGLVFVPTKTTGIKKMKLSKTMFPPLFLKLQNLNYNLLQQLISINLLHTLGLKKLLQQLLTKNGLMHW
jgi:hypothetical protein